MNRTLGATFRVLSLFLFTLLACIVSPGALQRQPVDLLIQGGFTLTMNPKREIFPDGLVAVRGDRIIAVGNRRELASRFRSRQVIQARGAAVLPGLINGHTHAAMTLFRGIADDLGLHQWLEKYIFPAEAKNVTREFVTWGTRLACLEMIRSGTTTFADMYYFEDAVAEVTAQAGMRAVLAESVLDFPTPDHRNPQASLQYADRFVKRWQGHPLIIPAIGPHAPYTNSTETLKKVEAFAQLHDVPVLMHVAETRREVEDISKRYGARPVEYLDRIGLLNARLIAAHCVHVNQREIELLRRRQVGVVHNPQSNMKLASGIAPVPQMIRARVALGLGTDGAASNNTLDMFEAMKTAALLHKVASGDPKVVSAYQVLEMATINGARALHLEKEIGSLEPGKRADIIIVRLNAPHQVPLYHVDSQLVYATEGSDVKSVIVNGRVIMRDRRVLTLDEAKILAKANQFRDKVVESLKTGGHK